MSFKLHATLRSVMKSRVVVLCPTRDMNHPFVRRLHALDSPHPFVTWQRMARSTVT